MGDKDLERLTNGNGKWKKYLAPSLIVTVVIMLLGTVFTLQSTAIGGNTEKIEKVDDKKVDKYHFDKMLQNQNELIKGLQRQGPPPEQRAYSNQPAQHQQRWNPLYIQRVLPPPPPPGAPPPPDFDGDGVPAHLDHCPQTPRGIQVDQTGCPILIAPRTQQIQRQAQTSIQIEPPIEEKQERSTKEEFKRVLKIVKFSNPALTNEKAKEIAVRIFIDSITTTE